MSHRLNKKSETEISKRKREVEGRSGKVTNEGREPAGSDEDRRGEYGRGRKCGGTLKRRTVPAPQLPFPKMYKSPTPAALAVPGTRTSPLP